MNNIDIPEGRYVFCGALLVKVHGSYMYSGQGPDEDKVRILVANKTDEGWQIKFVRNGIRFAGSLKAV